MVAGVRHGNETPGMNRRSSSCLGSRPQTVAGKTPSSPHGPVSQMNPNYLPALTVTVVPGTPLARQLESGDFELPEPPESPAELRLFLEQVDVKATVFRSNHASNLRPTRGPPAQGQGNAWSRN